VSQTESQTESQRAIRHRAEVLSSLLKVEAFQMLEETLLKKQRRDAEQLLAILTSEDGVEDPQRLLDRYRGFVAGLNYAMAVPRGAQRSLQGEVEEEEEPEMTDGWAAWAR
jgi:hypothetical protein